MSDGCAVVKYRSLREERDITQNGIFWIRNNFFKDTVAFVYFWIRKNFFKDIVPL